jgi:hypothetical protein
MSPLTEAAADRLEPAQAAALARVLGLQAEWQNLKDDGRDHSTARLQGLQRTFEAFRAGLAGYAADYPGQPVPTATPTSPARLGAWCRVVGAVVRRAAPGPDGVGPAPLGAWAYRMADGLAGRLGAGPVPRAAGSPADGLEAVGAWCGGAAVRPGAAGGSPPFYETAGGRAAEPGVRPGSDPRGAGRVES